MNAPGLLVVDGVYSLFPFPFSLLPFALYSSVMPVLEVLSILALAAIAWFWLDSLKAREAAVRAAREVCAAEGVQFLDDTVAIASLKPMRDDDGQLTLQRAYNFEYSDTGNNRLKGSIVPLGHRVIVLNVGMRPAPEVRTLH